MSNQEYEIFIPFNSLRDYMHVEFVDYKKDEEEGFNNVMIISYNGAQYELFWDDYNFYWVGTVEKEKGYIV